MSEKHKEDDHRENNHKKEEKPFIHERITGKKHHGISMGVLAALTLGLAVVFGITASLTFVLSKPMWERRFSEPETRESVVIGRDDTSAAETSAGETLPEEDPSEGESETPEETENAESSTAAAYSEGFPADWQDRVLKMLENDRADVNDFKAMYNDLNNINMKVNKSLVTVTASSVDTDWFDNAVSSQKETCGVIISITGQEILILTDSVPLEGFDELKVTFGNYGFGVASVKQIDDTWDISVLSVPLSDLAESAREKIEAIPLGNSYISTQGQPVIAIGSPLGYTRSIAYGIISYINGDVQGTDMTVRLIQTDIPRCADGRGMLVNADGELVGWLTEKYNSSATAEMLTAISISDMKPLIEKLSNGKAMACLGIRGLTVTEEIAQRQNLPVGVYISRCITDRPAYLEGLQSGDIITKIGEYEIHTMKDLQSAMELHEPGEQVQVAAARGSREGYQEFTVTVTLQAR